MPGAILTGATLDDADLTDVDMTNAVVDDGAFDKAILCNTTLPDGRARDRDCVYNERNTLDDIH